MVKKQTVSRLTKAPYWHTFAEYLLAGHNQADAYRLARPHLKWERATLVAEASKLASDPRVEDYIASEQAKRANARRKREAKLMDNLERREICREVATAEESNGLTKLAAVKTDAKLAGEWLERQEVSSTVNLQALVTSGKTTHEIIERSLAALSFDVDHGKTGNLANILFGVLGSGREYISQKYSETLQTELDQELARIQTTEENQKKASELKLQLRFKEYLAANPRFLDDVQSRHKAYVKSRDVLERVAFEEFKSLNSIYNT